MCLCVVVVGWGGGLDSAAGLDTESARLDVWSSTSDHGYIF